jgi:hypothetical protein
MVDPSGNTASPMPDRISRNFQAKLEVWFPHNIRTTLECVKISRIRREFHALIENGNAVESGQPKTNLFLLATKPTVSRRQIAKPEIANPHAHQPQRRSAPIPGRSNVAARAGGGLAKERVAVRALLWPGTATLRLICRSSPT